MKHFIITIDTEGDNLWSWKQGESIATENVKYLHRFQSLCDNYGYKPVWLTNYEMICDPDYVDFISKVEESRIGELGMHLHAWNTPPDYGLKGAEKGAPYLIEYPRDIMDEKIKVLTDLIRERTGIKPISHRAGRWAMNATYFELLKKYGYCVDCSVTPHENWSNHLGATKGFGGSDYSGYPEGIYWVDDEKTLLEVPLTVRKANCFFAPERMKVRALAGRLKRMVKGENIWLRPGHSGECQMHYLIEKIAKRDAEKETDYVMFMLHSSELMPGGSPTFKTKESIEELYAVLDRLFSHISREFTGITLRDYYGKIRKEEK